MDVLKETNEKINDLYQKMYEMACSNPDQSAQEQLRIQTEYIEKSSKSKRIKSTFFFFIYYSFGYGIYFCCLLFSFFCCSNTAFFCLKYLAS